VSAILKALKKLEQDTAATAGVPLRREAKRHNQWGSKSVMAPVLIGVTISVLVVVVLMMVLKNPSVDNAMKISGTPATGPGPVVNNSQTDEQIQENLPQTLDSEDLPSMAQNIASTTNVPAGKVPDGQAMNNNFNKSVDVQPVPYPDEFGSLQKSQALELKKNIQSNEPISMAVEPVVHILEDSSLELQAISWSSDPAGRMAVINGKICREKDRVDGYVIKKISSGDVVLAKGAVLGKLVFKIR
jgi:hypothetical protein